MMNDDPIPTSFELIILKQCIYISVILGGPLYKDDNALTSVFGTLKRFI